MSLSVAYCPGSVPKNTVNFKSYKSFISKGEYSEGGVSYGVNKALNSIKRRLGKNPDLDVLVDRDGRVAWIQLGFSNSLKQRNHLDALDCDHRYAYGNADSDGKNLLQEFNKKYKEFKKKYKNQLLGVQKN